MKTYLLFLILIFSSKDLLAIGYEWSFIDTKLPITNSMVNLNAVEIIGDSIWNVQVLQAQL